jgi:uncharacterized membrane protein YphA (DoxX/SURF4 family)
MLNTFPELLSLSGYGPFILRVVVGIIFLDLGFLKLKKEKARWIATFEALHINPSEFVVVLYGVLEIVGGGLLILGLYTQLAALAFAIFTGLELYIEWRDGLILKRGYIFYLLLFAISISILLTGAGNNAIDIPL